MFEKASSSMYCKASTRFAGLLALCFILQICGQTAHAADADKLSNGFKITAPGKQVLVAQSIASATPAAAAGLSSTEEALTISLTDAVSSGKVTLQLKGDGSTTTHVQMFLQNKTTSRLLVVIAANEIIHPGKLGTQDMMVTQDRLVSLKPGGVEVVFPIDTMCVSYKTIPPPSADKADYSAGAYKDEKTWRQFSSIIAASKDLAHKGKYDAQIQYAAGDDRSDPKVTAARRKTQQEKNAQLAIWSVLGLSSSNPEDAVTTKTLANDTVRQIKQTVQRDPATLETLLAAGGKLNKKHEFIPSPQQKKAIDNLSDDIFKQVDLTIGRSKEPDLKEIADLPKTPWDTFYNVGIRAFDAGELTEASEVLEAAVKEAENFGEADARLSKSILSMGRCFVDGGIYETAAPLLDRALSLREKVTGKKSYEVAEVTNDIGVLHQRQLQYNEAQTYFTSAYDIASNVSVSDAGSLVAQILDNLGRNYCLLGQGDLAVTKLQQALALTLEATKGEQTAEVAEVDANLATAYALTNNASKAEGLYMSASNIASKALGADNLFSARVLDGLGELVGSKDLQRSASLKKEAQVLREKTIGKDYANRISAIPASYDALTRMQRSVAGQKEIWANQDELRAAGALAQANDPELKKPIKDKWAVVIGISKFQDPSINLKYSRKDAEDFASFLTKEAHFAPDHVHVLLDEQATVANIKTEIGDKFLARVANPDDLVVIYLSSHGSSSKVDLRGANFFVGYNTDKDKLYGTGLDMAELSQMIKQRILAKRVLVLLDACHSGATPIPGAKGLFRVSNFSADDVAQGTGQLVICSSDPSQVSWESKRYENGVFTHCLIEGFRKNTKLSDVVASLHDTVLEEVLRDRGEQQTPMLKSAWTGDELILGVPPSQARPGMPQDLDEIKNASQPKTTPVVEGKSVGGGAARAAATKGSITKSPIVKAPAKGTASAH